MRRNFLRLDNRNDWTMDSKKIQKLIKHKTHPEGEKYTWVVLENIQKGRKWWHTLIITALRGRGR